MVHSMISLLKLFRPIEILNKNFLIGVGVTFVVMLLTSISICDVSASPCTEVTVTGVKGASGSGGTGGIGDTGGTGGIRGIGGTGGYNGNGGTGGSANLGVNGIGIAIVQCNIEIDGTSTP